MACDLTKGRALPCRESVGGLKAVYFVDFGDLGTLTSGEFTVVSGFAYQTLAQHNSQIAFWFLTCQLTSYRNLHL